MLQRDAIQRHAPRLKSEPTRVGERIQAERIPKRFRPYGNLYRLALADGWRALDTIRVRKDLPPGMRILFIGTRSATTASLGTGADARWENA